MECRCCRSHHPPSRQTIASHARHTRHTRAHARKHKRTLSCCGMPPEPTTDCSKSILPVRPTRFCKREIKGEGVCDWKARCLHCKRPQTPRTLTKNRDARDRVVDGNGRRDDVGDKLREVGEGEDRQNEKHAVGGGGPVELRNHAGTQNDGACGRVGVGGGGATR